MNEKNKRIYQKQIYFESGEELKLEITLTNTCNKHSDTIKNLLDTMFKEIKKEV